MEATCTKPKKFRAVFSYRVVARRMVQATRRRGLWATRTVRPPRGLEGRLTFSQRASLINRSRARPVHTSN
jgi:hypothetical protein